MSKTNALTPEALHDLLESKFREYNHKGFIADDPLGIPHLFTLKQDVEISGLLAATIAWGNRKSIVKNARSLVEIMDNSPYAFVTGASKKELERLNRFVHRTFNGNDAIDFIMALRKVYRKHPSLENLFVAQGNAMDMIAAFRAQFVKGFGTTHALKHVSDPVSGSAAKRLNMYLRWMVRRDKAGVDLGIWRQLDPKDLMLPLDVHTGNVARKLGLLTRNQNDARAVAEVTRNLQQFDATDPVKYDFALFGLGIFEKF